MTVRVYYVMTTYSDISCSLTFLVCNIDMSDLSLVVYNQQVCPIKYSCM